MDKIQEEIIEEFSVFDDWLDKYDYLIGLSETLPPIAPEHRTEQYLISGCSPVYGSMPGLRRGASTTRPTATPSSPRASLRC